MEVGYIAAMVLPIKITKDSLDSKVGGGGMGHVCMLANCMCCTHMRSKVELVHGRGLREMKRKGGREGNSFSSVKKTLC